MNRISTSASLALIGGFLGICAAADQKKEVLILPPFAHTYVWHEFTVSKEAPFSDNRYYRLQGVRKNGEVELIDCAVASLERKIVVVKPAPKKVRDGDRPPTIIVVTSDFKKQSATIRELRIK